MDAYNRALAAYTQHLNAEERSRVAIPTTLAKLVVEAQVMATVLGQKRKQSSVVRTLDEKAALLAPFGVLVEGLCKSSPIAGELIWSSVSFVLQMGTYSQMMKNDASAFEEVLGFFQTMAEAVGLISFQEDIFVHSTLVQSVVEGLYGAILDFWVEAVKYYRSRHSGLRRRLKILSLSSSIDKKFQALTEAIDKQRKRLLEVSTMQHNADSASFFIENKRHQRTAHQRQLKEWLNAPDYERDFREANNRRYEGTCKWIQSKEEFSSWVTSTTSPLLFVHGIPGAGKTVLSSWVISEPLWSNAGGDSLVLYHFFNGFDTIKRTPASAIRSFIDQLFNYLRCTEHPLLLYLESTLDLASVQHSPHIDFVNLWDIFSATVTAFAGTGNSADPQIIIILDAMDECESPQTPILRILNLAHQNQGKIKLFATGRKSAWTAVERSHSTSYPAPHVLEISYKDIQRDIRMFVQNIISSIPRLRGQEHLRNRLCQEIEDPENNRGMFLWAFLMCEEVKQQGDVQALQKLMVHPPKGLDAMYGRICHTIIERDESVGLCLSVLQWIAHSPRPLQFFELQEGLRLMRARIDGSTSRNEEWFDGKSDLLWSREDIVDACGNLVVHSGVDRGDFFTFIHLSATQFFQSNPAKLRLLLPNPESVKGFIEDIQCALPTLGVLSLQYLLSNTLQSDDDFEPDITVWGVSATRPSSSLNTLIDRYPLFPFVVAHWPDLALRSFKAKTMVTADLLKYILAFISDPFSTVWLEYFIRQSSIEIAIFTLRQIADVSIGQPELVEITAWACGVNKTLGAFMQTLFRRPELVRKCCGIANLARHKIRMWQIVHDTMDSDSYEVPPLEAASRAWVHYNADKDILLSAEGRSDAMCLRSRIMTKGMPMRPALVQSQDQISGMSFVFHSAAVSPNRSLIVIAFHSHHQSKFIFSIACWRLPISGVLLSPKSQVDMVLFDRVETQRTFAWNSSNRFQTNVSTNIVAFRGNDVLITPRGIWDLHKGEWLSGPATIYEPSGELSVMEQTCFCASGERAARVRNNEGHNKRFVAIEVLDTREGMNICTVRFPDATKLSLQAFSCLGEKLILLDDRRGGYNSLGRRQAYNLCLCILVDDQSLLELDIPYPIHGLDSPQFTADEQALVASFDGPQVASIAIWRFVKDGDGRYLPRASMSHLFKSRDCDFAFCLAPEPHHTNGTSSAIIVTRFGNVTRRPLGAKWSDDEEKNLQKSPYRTLSRIEVIPEAKIFNIKTFSKSSVRETPVSFERWSFEQSQLQLIDSADCSLDLTFNVFRPEWMSASGNLLVGNGYLFRISIAQIMDLSNLGLKRHPLPLRGLNSILAVTFSSDDGCVALLHHNDDDPQVVTLSIFDIRPESVARRASLHIATTFATDLNPTPFLSLRLNGTSDLSKLAVVHSSGKRRFRTLLIEMNDSQELTLSNEVFHDHSWEYPTKLSFSHCHTYMLLWNDGSLWPVLRALQAPSQDIQDRGVHAFVHPTVLHLDECYVHHPYMLTMRRESPHSGVLLLDLKLVGTRLQFHSRNICILPDRVIGENLDTVYLVWPSEDSDSEVLVVVATARHPDVIGTGVKSGDMMKRDAWVHISGIKKYRRKDPRQDSDGVPDELEDNSEHEDGTEDGGSESEESDNSESGFVDDLDDTSNETGIYRGQFKYRRRFTDINVHIGGNNVDQISEVKRKSGLGQAEPPGPTLPPQPPSTLFAPPQSAPLLSVLVLPNIFCPSPIYPFDVPVTVFLNLICAVFGNVVSGAPLVSVIALSERRTSAKLGAFTLRVQMFVVVSQGMVMMFSSQDAERLRDRLQPKCNLPSVTQMMLRGCPVSPAPTAIPTVKSLVPLGSVTKLEWATLTGMLPSYISRSRSLSALMWNVNSFVGGEVSGCRVSLSLGSPLVRPREITIRYLQAIVESPQRSTKHIADHAKATARRDVGLKHRVVRKEVREYRFRVHEGVDAKLGEAVIGGVTVSRAEEGCSTLLDSKKREILTEKASVPDILGMPVPVATFDATSSPPPINSSKPVIDNKTNPHLRPMLMTRMQIRLVPSLQTDKIIPKYRMTMLRNRQPEIGRIIEGDTGEPVDVHQ
ncbi:hypothetical protein DXG01_008339 [Tephrocybe rancida]|nr:hypothetical protein DXG01_008339 [Tephrocybe rancida]